MKIHYNNFVVDIQRMQDTTHILWNGRPMHVGEIKSKELADDLYDWLSKIILDEVIEKKYYYHNFIKGSI